MKTIIRKKIKSVLRSLGYDIHKTKPFQDAFEDQKSIFLSIPVSTIFDVGANVGEVTSKYRALFPQATIYSFEPFPGKFNGGALKHDEKVNKYQMAISNIIGEVDLYVYQANVLNSLLMAKDNVDEYVKAHKIKKLSKITVPSTTIDNFCKEKAIAEITILKMDIQGGELMALEGATEMLKQGGISLIYMEVAFIAIYEKQPLFYDVYHFLSQYGYVLFNLYYFRRTLHGQIKWCDAIFVNPEIIAAIM